MTAATMLSTLRKPKAVRMMSFILLLVASERALESLNLAEATMALKWRLIFLAQFPEHEDSAPLSPSHPLGECADDFIGTGLEVQTQVFLEDIGAVEFGIGFGEELALGLLFFRQMLRVFEQGIADVFYRLCLFLLHRLALCRLARFVPGLTFFLPTGLSDQASRRTCSRASVAQETTWKGSMHRWTQYSSTQEAIHPTPSAET